MRQGDARRLLQMASPTDVRPLAPAHRRGVSEGGSPALRWGLRGGGRSWQLCLCPGTGEVEEPPPEMQDLGTRNNSGEEEAVTRRPFQWATSSGFCRAGAFSLFLLELFTWEPLLFQECLCQAAGKTPVPKGDWVPLTRPWAHRSVRCRGPSGDEGRRKTEEAWLENGCLCICGIPTQCLLCCHLTEHHFSASCGRTEAL